MTLKITPSIVVAILLLVPGCGWVRGAKDNRIFNNLHNALESGRCYEAEQYADKYVPRWDRYEHEKKERQAQNWTFVSLCYERIGDAKRAKAAWETARARDWHYVWKSEESERQAAREERERRERQAQLEREKQSLAQLPDRVEVMWEHRTDLFGTSECYGVDLYNEADIEVHFNRCPDPIFLPKIYHKVVGADEFSRGYEHKICSVWTLHPGQVIKSEAQLSSRELGRVSQSTWFIGHYRAQQDAENACIDWCDGECL